MPKLSPTEERILSLFKEQGVRQATIWQVSQIIDISYNLASQKLWLLYKKGLVNKYKSNTVSGKVFYHLKN
ncbi:hypothetical protein COS64_01140 [archaeon CG06_land_8_20_14_3_00_37_11]|nr:MAG: hypothetical protein COS64_01140 [archaeon CG06_land_8_20_14_3_00_37_11]